MQSVEVYVATNDGKIELSIEIRKGLGMFSRETMVLMRFYMSKTTRIDVYIENLKKELSLIGYSDRG